MAIVGRSGIFANSRCHATKESADGLALFSVSVSLSLLVSASVSVSIVVYNV